MQVGVPEIIYLLCALASSTCALLLMRAHLRVPTKLLFWSAIAFALMAVDNLLLVVDMIVVPQRDLRVLRTFIGLLGMVVLLFALVNRSQENE